MTFKELKTQSVWKRLFGWASCAAIIWSEFESANRRADDAWRNAETLRSKLELAQSAGGVDDAQAKLAETQSLLLDSNAEAERLKKQVASMASVPMAGKASELQNELVDREFKIIHLREMLHNAHRELVEHECDLEKAKAGNRTALRFIVQAHHLRLKSVAILALGLSTLSSWAAFPLPFQHNFFTTNPAPVVDAVAGSNCFVTPLFVGTGTRRFRIDIPASGAATFNAATATTATNGPYGQVLGGGPCNPTNAYLLIIGDSQSAPTTPYMWANQLTNFPWFNQITVSNAAVVGTLADASNAWYNWVTSPQYVSTRTNIISCRIGANNIHNSPLSTFVNGLSNLVNQIVSSNCYPVLWTVMYRGDYDDSTQQTNNVIANYYIRSWTNYWRLVDAQAMHPNCFYTGQFNADSVHELGGAYLQDAFEFARQIVSPYRSQPAITYSESGGTNWFVVPPNSTAPIIISSSAGTTLTGTVNSLGPLQQNGVPVLTNVIGNGGGLTNVIHALTKFCGAINGGSFSTVPNYASPNGSVVSGTEINISTPFISGGIITNFFVKTIAMGANTNLTASVMTNGVASSLVVTYIGNGSNQQYSNTVNSATLPNNGSLSIKLIGDNPISSSCRTIWSFEIQN